LPIPPRGWGEKGNFLAIGPDYASIPASSGPVTSLSTVPGAISTASMLLEEDSLEKVLYNTRQSCLSWDSGISQLQAFNEKWEKEAWRKVDELWERVCAMYPVSEEHSKRYKEIWSEMIEGYKREASEEKKSVKERGSFEICIFLSITVTLKLLLGRGIGKTRPICCRVVCLGGLWVVP
jgi:hypothetical protein